MFLPRQVAKICEITEKTIMPLFTKKTILATTLAIASSLSPAIAEEKERGFYATLGAGVGKHADISISSASGGGVIEFDRGFAGDIGVGYDFGSIRTELTYNNVNNDVNTIQNISTNVSAEFESVFLSAYYDFRADKDWQPYVGGGFGSTEITVTNSYSGINLTAGDDNISSGKFAIGVNYGGNENIDIYGEYSVQAYDDFTIGNYWFKDCVLGAITIGTRFKF